MIKEFMEMEVEVMAAFPKPKGFSYRNISDLILTWGKVWKVRKIPISILKNEDYTNPMACFANAYRLARELNYCYVEGYAYKLVFPMLHAWVIDSKGMVLDPTWGIVKDGYKKYYIGIPLDINFVNISISRQGEYGILDDWKSGFPLLRKFELGYIDKRWKHLYKK